MGIATFPAPSGGVSSVQPKWVLIGSDVTTGASATRTISSIPQTYSALKLIANGYRNPNNNFDVGFRINNDTNGNYAYSIAAWGGLDGTRPAQNIGESGVRSEISNSFGDNTKQDQRCYFEAVIYNYTSTTDPKTWESWGTNRTAFNNQSWSMQGHGFYNPSSAAAITSVSLIGPADLALGSSNQGWGFFVYGAL